MSEKNKTISKTWVLGKCTMIGGCIMKNPKGFNQHFNQMYPGQATQKVLILTAKLITLYRFALKPQETY